MIDIDFAKLILIGIVTLIVVGPEKFPTVARMAGSLLGRAQRYINEIKSEVSHDIELEEFRKIHQEIEKTGRDIEKGVAKNLLDSEKKLYENWDNTSQNNDSITKKLVTKSKIFRNEKIMRNSMIPRWYRKKSSQKLYILSSAARFAKDYPAIKNHRLIRSQND